MGREEGREGGREGGRKGGREGGREIGMERGRYNLSGYYNATPFLWHQRSLV